LIVLVVLTDVDVDTKSDKSIMGAFMADWERRVRVSGIDY
jgi:hypothetical protein